MSKGSEQEREVSKLQQNIQMIGSLEKNRELSWWRLQHAVLGAEHLFDIQRVESEQEAHNPDSAATITPSNAGPDPGITATPLYAGQDPHDTAIKLASFQRRFMESSSGEAAERMREMVSELMRVSNAHDYGWGQCDKDETVSLAGHMLPCDDHVRVCSAVLDSDLEDIERQLEKGRAVLWHLLWALIHAATDDPLTTHLLPELLFPDWAKNITEMDRKQRLRKEQDRARQHEEELRQREERAQRAMQELLAEEEAQAASKVAKKANKRTGSSKGAKGAAAVPATSAPAPPPPHHNQLTDQDAHTRRDADAATAGLGEGSAGSISHAAAVGAMPPAAAASGGPSTSSSQAPALPASSLTAAAASGPSTSSASSSQQGPALPARHVDTKHSRLPPTLHTQQPPLRLQGPQAPAVHAPAPLPASLASSDIGPSASVLPRGNANPLWLPDDPEALAQSKAARKAAKKERRRAASGQQQQPQEVSTPGVTEVGGGSGPSAATSVSTSSGTSATSTSTTSVEALPTAGLPSEASAGDHTQVGMDARDDAQPGRRRQVDVDATADPMSLQGPLVRDAARPVPVGHAASGAAVPEASPSYPHQEAPRLQEAHGHQGRQIAQQQHSQSAAPVLQTRTRGHTLEPVQQQQQQGGGFAEARGPLLPETPRTLTAPADHHTTPRPQMASMPSPTPASTSDPRGPLQQADAMQHDPSNSYPAAHQHHAPNAAGVHHTGSADLLLDPPHRLTLSAPATTATTTTTRLGGPLGHLMAIRERHQQWQQHQPQSGPQAAPPHQPASTAPPPPLLNSRVAVVTQGEEPPLDICCPITHEVMVDPVFAMDTHTYERRAIEQWLEKHDTSPLTGAPLPSKMLMPNTLVRKIINEYRSQLPGGA